MRSILVYAGLFFFLAQAFAASAQEANCVRCHKKIVKGKVLHAALETNIRCRVCHAGIIAKYRPHKKSNTGDKGLIATQPELCYSCHDKALFTRKDVHAALGMGCTGCHNPHSTDTAKLLVSSQPELCYTCHDKAMFTRKSVHAAVGMGCTGCHNPHASDEMALLVKKPVSVCLECHGDVMNKPHMDIGSPSARHPLGDTVKKLSNPAQLDKPFYCGSCHDPHSTDTPKLLRFNAQSAQDLCRNCH